MQTKWTYYNEFDEHAAAWLRELIKRNLISPGEVDERSITEVKPNDIRGFRRVHFFAGIGGWELALQLARWPEDRPVWTGSCPCQPFSTAGKQLAQADVRHLWPVLFNLVRECRPHTVFGEQVASAIEKGWLDGVSADLEGENYACWHAVLGAHSVGAPHIRQRLYWVANSQSNGLIRCNQERGVMVERPEDSRELKPSGSGKQGIDSGLLGRSGQGGPSASGGVVQPVVQGLEGLTGNVGDRNQSVRDNAGSVGPTTETSNPWAGAGIIHCRDGKARRVKPGVPLLAHGVPARVVRLRGYGNAIVPQVAAEFIKAFSEVTKN